MRITDDVQLGHSTAVARLMRDEAGDPPLGVAIDFEDVADVDELMPARRDLTGWHSRLGRRFDFSTPLGRWFARWVQQDAEDFLAGPQARSPVFIRRVRAILQTARRRPALQQRQLTSLLVLEVWLRHQASGRRP